jgi:hypothetical protein
MRFFITQSPVSIFPFLQLLPYQRLYTAAVEYVYHIWRKGLCLRTRSRGLIDDKTGDNINSRNIPPLIYYYTNTRTDENRKARINGISVEYPAV